MEDKQHMLWIHMLRFLRNSGDPQQQNPRISQSLTWLSWTELLLTIPNKLFPKDEVEVYVYIHMLHIYIYAMGF